MTSSYDVREVLGSGSFGVVRRIRRKSDSKCLVWKEVKYGKMNDREKQQIVAEVNIMRGLRHPFIVRFFDRIIDRETATLYIVMEYCSGGDLGQVIRRARHSSEHLSERFLWRLLSQVLLALKECHGRAIGNDGEKDGDRRCPIVHRDIKPANIFLDANGNAKLGDFGLAKELGGEGMLAQTSAGTPYYMSPEMLSEECYDERSDVWSVGCLMYEAAALSRPFEATNHLALALRIREGRVARIPQRYSDDLWEVTRKCLTVDRSRRPAVADLELHPKLALPLRENRLLVREHRLQAAHTHRLRELQAKEAALQQREEDVAARAEELAAKVDDIAAREARLRRREAAVAAAVGAVAAAAGGGAAKAGSGGSGSVTALLGAGNSSGDRASSPTSFCARSFSRDSLSTVRTASPTTSHPNSFDSGSGAAPPSRGIAGGSNGCGNSGGELGSVRAVACGGVLGDAYCDAYAKFPRKENIPPPKASSAVHGAGAAAVVTPARKSADAAAVMAPQRRRQPLRLQQRFADEPIRAAFR